MKKMRWCPWVVLGAVLLFSLPTGLAAADPVVLKIGTLAPEGSTWTKVFREINKELEQKTGKQVTLRVFPGGVLGDEEDMLRKIKVGQIQGGFFTGGGLGIIFNDLRILAIPFLFESYKEVDALMGKMAGFFEKGFLANGYKIMGWGENGFIYLLSKQPIKNAADLRKGKVWIWEDTAIGRAVFKEIGVNPIPLGIPDVLVSLQTGMIDTVYGSPLAAISMQWFTRVSYLTDLPLSYSVGALVVQKSAFDKIPKELQGPVEEIFRKHLDPMKTAIRQENQKALGVMTRQGIKTVTPTAKDVSELQASVLKAVDPLGDSIFSRKTFEEIKGILKSLRKEK
ncbi:MAG: TRAP transporter substrate-binding protein DctP [Deltaproteobacteria bacterium]|nr:TRAP transporter substrate-binding protein DctP [Deltaproteobacteria bacterium]